MADAGKAMMLYKGVYDRTYIYEKLDVVNYNGSLYISTTDGNLDTEPTDTTKWKLFLEGGIANNIQATDTHGLVGEAGESSFVQLLLDSLASRIGKDSAGNVISDTYATKTELPAKVSELENDSGFATDEELKKTSALAALNKQTLGYGKKNLLKNIATTYTTNGVTYAVNNDGSITANGTATADATINISDFVPTQVSKFHVETLKSGNYILSGISGGSNTTYFIQYRDNTRALSQNATDGDKVINVVNGNSVCVLIQVKAGNTANNLTFYPMIRSADIVDDTYEPYVDDVDTRIENLKSSTNKMVSSALNGKQFATLDEFVEATASDITHGHMFRFADPTGWGPVGKAGQWYRCIVEYQNPYRDSNNYPLNGCIIITVDEGTNFKNWLGTISGVNKASGVSVIWERIITDKYILNTLEEISANTKTEMIAGALALKELNGNINRDFYGTNGSSPVFDLMPNGDVTAPLSRLGRCYIYNEEAVETYHAPEIGYALAFGEKVSRYGILFLGVTKMWYRTTSSDWKEV